MATKNGKKPVTVASPEEMTTELVDIVVQVPEAPGYPETLRIRFNLDAADFASQYRDALFVARGIPFNIDALSPTDVMSIIVANTTGKMAAMNAQEAVRRAQQWYRRWAEKAEQDAWTLAVLYDNTFDFVPKPYEEKTKSGRTAPGLQTMPEPKLDITDPVEYRLKQILDVINLSPEFRRHTETIINDVLTKLAQYGQAVKETDPLGFRPGAVGGQVQQDDGSDDNDNGAES